MNNAHKCLPPFQGLLRCVPYPGPRCAWPGAILSRPFQGRLGIGRTVCRSSILVCVERARPRVGSFKQVKKRKLRNS